MFEAPIPGQSLTSEPRKYPYERPPEISDPEEAIKMHLSRLSKEDKVQDIIDILEIDKELVSVVDLTQGILRSAVATGLHSIDVSLAIAPVIHEYIKGVAEDAGIDYEEGLVDKKEKAKRKEVLDKARAYKKIDEIPDWDPEMLEDDDEPEPQVDDVPETEEPSEGLIPRRVK
jgi:hypothetical protein